MAFHQIKNNDLARAEIVMDNFRHINYGNNLLPVNEQGKSTDRLLNLGSPSHKWNNTYINNAIVSNEIRYSNRNIGDMYYLNKDKVQEPIPIGEKGAYLKCNGPEEAPNWEKLPEWPIKMIVDTGWNELDRKNITNFEIKETVDRFEDFFLYQFNGKADGYDPHTKTNKTFEIHNPLFRFFYPYPYSDEQQNSYTRRTPIFGSLLHVISEDNKYLQVGMNTYHSPILYSYKYVNEFDEETQERLTYGMLGDSVYNIQYRLRMYKLFFEG